MIKGKRAGEDSDDEDNKDLITAAIQSLKRKKLSLDFYENEDEDEYIVNDMIALMERAADLDDQNNELHKPGIEKLAQLDKVAKFLVNQRYHNMFLNSDGCYHLRRWLERLPDGSWPNKPVRLTLIELLHDLPLTVEHLQKSDLGKVIKSMSKTRGEDAAIKTQCNALIQKWSRLIYDISTNYANLEEIERHRRFSQSIPVPQKRVAPEDSSSKVSLPDTGQFNFKFRPVSRLDTQMSQVIGDSKLTKSLKRVQNPRRTKERIMSVDGRGLNY